MADDKNPEKECAPTAEARAPLSPQSLWALPFRILDFRLALILVFLAATCGLISPIAGTRMALAGIALGISGIGILLGLFGMYLEAADQTLGKIFTAVASLHDDELRKLLTAQEPPAQEPPITSRFRH